MYDIGSRLELQKKSLFSYCVNQNVYTPKRLHLWSESREEGNNAEKSLY